MPTVSSSVNFGGSGRTGASMLKQAVFSGRLLPAGSLRSRQWNLPVLESLSEDDQALAGFEELAMPLVDSLYNFARWLVHNNSNAEDLVQETYLNALRSFASFQPGSNFRAWMFRILKDTFLSSCSTLERRMDDAMVSEKDGHQLAVVTETPETTLMNRADSQSVQRAIDDLPVRYRETLLLCEVEEMSYQEIADILSIPIRSCYVVSGQSPQGSSRVDTYRSGSRSTASMRLKEILIFMGLIFHRSPDALACFIGDMPPMAKGIEI